MHARPAGALQDVMTTKLATLNAKTAEKHAANLLMRDNFRATPIIDDVGVIIGAIPIGISSTCSKGPSRPQNLQ